MTKVLIMPDSFKGSYSSDEICDFIDHAILENNQSIETMKIPLSDGGEGFTSFFQKRFEGTNILTVCKNPLFENIETSYYLTKDNIAIIESAKIIGLSLIKNRLNPLITTSFGIGQVFLDAISKGAKTIFLGIGGSSTNDAGCGLLASLGVVFYDKENKSFIPTGGTLGSVYEIDTSKLLVNQKDVDIIVYHDVLNRLTGPLGASNVYAKQKGANEAQIADLEHQMCIFEKFINKAYQKKTKFKGAGAAGGLSIALKCFLNATLKQGIHSLLEMLDFGTLLQDIDFVLTGEGKFDMQSLQGKVIDGLAQYCSKFHVPLIAIVGNNEIIDPSLYPIGLKKVYSLKKGNEPLSETITNTPNRISEVIKEIFNDQI